MKSYPSEKILNNPIKPNFINQSFAEIKMNLTNYMLTLTNSVIKEKQILTMNGIQMLMLPEHKFLCENLKRKYPNLNLNGMC